MYKVRNNLTSKSLLSLVNILLLVLSVLVFCRCGTGENIVRTKESTKILFLGNSITIAPQNPQIGWYGRWGMAASKLERDYVHSLANKLKRNGHYRKIDILTKNMSHWETDFRDTTGFKSIKAFNADIVIVRLGENVNVDYAKNNDFAKEFEGMISYFLTKNTKGVIVTNNFWNNSYKDPIQKSVAIKNNYTFVDLSELASDTDNYAYGKFDNAGVAYHPSDFGMENIANSIYLSFIRSQWYKNLK